MGLHFVFGGTGNGQYIKQGLRTTDYGLFIKYGLGYKTAGVICRTPNAERRTPNAERRTPNAERRTPNAERLSVSGLSCKTGAIWYEIGSVDNHGRRANSYFEQV